MGIRPVDLEAFYNLPLWQLFSFQHLDEFLCPRYVKFYPSAVFEFYANLRTIDDALGVVNMINGTEVTIIDIEPAHFMGWTDEEIQENCVDWTVDDIYDEVGKILGDENFSYDQI